MTIDERLVIDKEKYFELIGYKPHAKQMEFHRSDARFKVVVAGRRAGKTQMTAKDIEPLLMIPDKRVWLVGSTYALSEKEFRIIWQDMIIKLGFGKDPSLKKSYSLQQGNMFIEFPWGTRIECKSAERKDTLVGDGLDLVVMCEASKHTRDTWERFIQPALSDKRGSAIFSTTPHGQDWVYELWQLGNDDNEPEYRGWQYPSWDNTIIYPGGRKDSEILRMERTMSKDWFLQEIAADFTSFSGKVYSEFREQTHVKNHTFRPDWPNFIGFDFGYVNPLAAIEFQVSPQDTIHIWREHYESGMTMEDHIRYLRNRDQPKGYKIDLTFGDAADPEAVTYLCRHFAPCIADPKSKDNWRDGIELVKQFLKIRDNGVPGLYVDPSCKNTIREFNNYKSSDTGKADRNPREDAKKSDDHCFVAGTLINTSKGNVPIENIKKGDLVLTRLGYRPVGEVFIRGKQEIYRLVTKSGKELLGTGDHPVMTSLGWVLLRDLMQYDTLFTWETPYGTTRIGPTGIELPAICGESTMEPYPLDMSFTTKMKTLETMTYPTCNASQQKSMQNFIGPKIEEKSSVNGSIQLDHLHQLGTEVLKELHGTPNMASALGKLEKYMKGHVNSAKVLTKLRSIGSEIGSVPTNARAVTAVLQALITSREYVPIALKSSASANTQKIKLVPDSVDKIYVENASEVVYDLSVPGSHEFFANGILVSNSMDAIRYGIMHIFKLGMRVRLSDVIDINELTSGLGDSGFFTNKGTSLFPSLETAGFVTLDGKTF